MSAPRLPKPVLGHPSLSDIRVLVDRAPTVRDKAVISMFADTGMRLSELAGITLDKIRWDNRTISMGIIYNSSQSPSRRLPKWYSRAIPKGGGYDSG